MKIELDQLIPYCLKDLIRKGNSAIWDRSICFEPAEWIKIQAPSGTGKTTLTHLLYRVRTDYTGSIRFDNKDLRSIDEDQLAELRRAHVGIVFQDLRLFPSLSARENNQIKEQLNPSFASSEWIEEMAGELGVSKILDQQIQFCSYGEQQRIAIIRALVQPFDWLILDEPFSHLDQNNIAIASALISKTCQKRNAGLILMGLDQDQHFDYHKAYTL